MTLVIGWSWILTLSGAVTVFDCEHPDTRFEVVDLLAPQDCPDPQADYEEVKTQKVQVIQTDTLIATIAYRCSVVVSRKVTRCGYDSIQYGSRWAMWEEELPTTPEECREAVERGNMTVDGRVYRTPKGQVSWYTYYSHGDLRPDGSCEYEDFKTQGVWYHKSYELTRLRISVDKIPAMHDTSEGTIKFTSGLQAVYKDQVLRDNAEGTLVWEAKEPECVQTISEIYLGDANLYRRKGDSLLESIVMIANEGTHQFAGLVLRKPRSVCEVHCYGTQIRGIAACLLRELDSPIPKISFQRHFDPVQANLQTQLSHLHIETNFRMYQRLSLIHI